MCMSVRGCLFICIFKNIYLFVCLFLRQGSSVALEPVLELALVNQAGLELTEIHLPLTPECWNHRPTIFYILKHLLV